MMSVLAQLPSPTSHESIGWLTLAAAGALATVVMVLKLFVAYRQLRSPEPPERVIKQSLLVREEPQYLPMKDFCQFRQHCEQQHADLKRDMHEIHAMISAAGKELRSEVRSDIERMSDSIKDAMSEATAMRREDIKGVHSRVDNIINEMPMKIVDLVGKQIQAMNTARKQ